MNSLRNKLGVVLNLIKYFKCFHDSELFDIKLNLSTPKGLRAFFKKLNNHSSLLNKKMQGDLKKIEGELIAE